MIVGHLGIAYGVRALDRREQSSAAPLPWLLAAAVAPDMLDGWYALHYYCNPDGVYSHSLPAAAILAVMLGAAAWLHTRSGATALLVAAVVMLHLPPDYLTGRKGLWPGGPVIGLYIYRWSWLDLLIEVPVIVTGWWMLRRTRFRPRWAVSALALAAMLTVQLSFDVAAELRGPRQPYKCAR
jgi:membrane-bound metal-dependent hydrolase YbcI (DUF457 family)